jgi:GNAT superfamily N-acetyltransferase
MKVEKYTSGNLTPYSKLLGKLYQIEDVKVVNIRLLNMLNLHGYTLISVYEEEIWDTWHPPENLLKGVCVYRSDMRMHCGPCLFIDSLIVEERGKGYGKALLSYLQDNYGVIGDNLLLDCPLENHNAQGFYKSNGFIPRGYSYFKTKEVFENEEVYKHAVEDGTTTS